MGDSSSSRDPAYFAYYGQLQHQQNMLADTERTFAYYDVITRKSRYPSFVGKRVMDVGAGSGILSFFACQAGATHVFAVEASQMAQKLELFLKESGSWKQIEVIPSKLEDVTQVEPNSVDTIISEPIGVLLVHERMLESFIMARDKFLKPDGYIFPTLGTICIAPFTDHTLWTETVTKSQWWNQTNFYGVDLSLHAERAANEYFSMPVVGSFPPQSLLCSKTSRHVMDFRKITLNDLYHIRIPIQWTAENPAVMHGIAGWFDCDFCPIPCNESKPPSHSQHCHTLSTHPSEPLTHWQQVRFLYREPLAVNRHDNVVGYMDMAVNEHRSYTVTGVVWIEDEPGQKRKNSERSAIWHLHEQTYNYSYVPTPSAERQSAISSPLNPEAHDFAMEEQ